jgi:hypothetical protein
MINKIKNNFSVAVGAVFVLGLGFVSLYSINTRVALADPSNPPGIGSGSLAVNATGSVSIATTTFSASKLRVAGSIESATGGFVFPDGSTQTTAASTTSISAGYITPGTFNSVAGTGGNYGFPAGVVLVSTTDSSSGVIYKGSNSFIHNFAPTSVTGHNIFAGENAGNFTMINDGFSFSASNNTGIGYQALNQLTTGNRNAANGAYALYSDTSGNRNAANGAYALYSNNGSLNTASGFESLYNNTLAINNTASGYRSLYDNITGSYNTAYGSNSGYSSGKVLSTMTSSTFLGYNAISSNDGVDNAMALGANAQVTKSNQVVIGNTSVSETLLNGSVGIGTSTAPTARLDVNTGTMAGNPIAFALTDTSSQWYAALARCNSCYVGGAAAGDLVLRSANSKNFFITADNGTTPSFVVTATNRIGIGTQAPSSSIHVVNGTGMTTIAVGSKSIGINKGRMCLWNGASYTLISFAANSITPTYATSTTC